MDVKSDNRPSGRPPSGGPHDVSEARARLVGSIRLCRGALKKLWRKQAKQEAELAEARRWVEYRQAGDSLLAAPARYPKGTTNVAVDNIHTGRPVEAKLNSKLDAVGNARLLYKKARKGERGAEIAASKVAETVGAVERIEALVARGEKLKSEGDDPGFAEMVERFAAAVAEQGLQSGAAGRERRAAVPKPPYRHFVIDGWDVYIGKNNTQNDELTTRFAKPWDLWMHVAAHSGSHVVIRRAKGADRPPRHVVEKAASLAVWFSKARHTSFAEVDVTEARFVRKPRKSPPGQVIAERCKTVRVAPKEPD